MSTHACIAILRPDTSIHSVYLHSDGYTSWAGVRLHKFFNTYAKAAELVSMGGIAVIGESIGVKHDRHDRYSATGDARMTSFYARDYEPLQELEIEHHANYGIFEKFSRDWEYVYFFNGEKWLTWSTEHPVARPLSEVLIKERITS